MTKKEAEVWFTVSGKEIKVDRPEPITNNISVVPFKRRMGAQEAVDALIEGHYVLIVDYYSSGLEVLNELKQHIKKKHADPSFKGQRSYRATYRKLSHRLLLKITNHKLTVRKAPEIGWIEKLYPGLDQFLLPFAQVQGLNSSWQWYTKGIKTPVLRERIYPFYGTYFPTRFEHLNLFESWLKTYSGEKKSAIDVGIGCGVLSYQMLNHGFEKIVGTDINPNAIIGISEAIKETRTASQIELNHGYLFDDLTQKADLIVFNPPWVPAPHNLAGIDKAVYYENDLFPNFFAEAVKHLTQKGKIVILFSNLAQISKVTDSHPIEEELSVAGRFQQHALLKKPVGKASQLTRRDQPWRDQEEVELWVLEKI